MRCKLPPSLIDSHTVWYYQIYVIYQVAFKMKAFKLILCIYEFSPER